MVNGRVTDGRPQDVFSAIHGANFEYVGLATLEDLYRIRNRWVGLDPSSQCSVFQSSNSSSSSIRSGIVPIKWRSYMCVNGHQNGVLK